MHEPLLPETDDDAVSILTIHGAKGLEFPITVVSGVTTELGKRRRGVEVRWGEGDRPEVKLNKATRTDNFDRLADIEVEMDEHERRRLLYVACTRARDHLLVCTHHIPGKQSYGAWLRAVTAEVEHTLCRRLPDCRRGGGGSGARRPADAGRSDAGTAAGRRPWRLDRRPHWPARARATPALPLRHGPGSAGGRARPARGR